MRQRPTLELLEPRILYSADTPSALAGALVGTPDAEHRLLDAEGEFATQTAPQEIVFVDARTPDSAQLIEDIAAQGGRDVEVIVLDAERNGLEQISEVLAGRENVAALHFISHGADGVMQLGNTLITADSLERNPDLVASWSQVFTADADILLYGCDIAASAQGRLLADTLARLTGADVCASDDATGHTSLGGNWTLEYATGVIDAPLALSPSAQGSWMHLLPSVVLTSYEPSFADLADNAYPLGMGTTYAQTFSYDSPEATYTANQIDLVLYRNAVTSGAGIDVELRDGLGGGSNLLASASVARAELTTSESWITVSLDTTATLADGATYYIVVNGGGGGGIFVGIADTNGYASGNLIVDSTAYLDKDLAFRVVSSNGPLVDLNGNQNGQDSSANFTEQTPVRIAQNGVIADPDSTNLTSLTATLTARPDGDAVESLSLNPNASNEASLAGLGVSYNAATGVLSITGSASVAIYENILQGILYNNTSDAPSTTDRAISVVITDDGGTQSAARTSVVRVTQLVNDAPVNNVPGAQTISEDTALFFSASTGNPISITDDATSPVQVLLASLNGVITLTSSAGLTFVVGDGTADSTMTFTGTVTAINAALDGMSFLPTAEFSGGASLSITTNDLGNTGIGIPLLDLDTVVITVVALNDPPVIAGAGGTLAYTEDAAATVIDGTLILSDMDDLTIESATITISAGLVSTEDVLSFTPAFGITGGYTAATGVLALSGNATLAQYEQVLESVRYQNTHTLDPTASARTITWVVNDGSDNSAGVTSTITLTAVNDAPVNNVPGAQDTNEDAVLVFSGGNAISIADADAGTNALQVVLAGTNGAITLAGIAGLTFSIGDGVADSSMTFTGTAGAINAALNGLSFMPGANFSGAASLSISTNDLGNTGAGGALSDSDAIAINVLANVAPTVTSSGGTTVFTEGINVASTPVVVDGAVTVSDPDSGTLASATVSITAGWQAAEDVLGFANDPATMGNIAGSYDAATGVLNLSSAGATATLAQWQTALRSVTYTNTSDTPSTAARSVSFVVSGQGGGSVASSQQVAVTATNDAPTVSASGGTTQFTGGGVAVVVDASVAVNDVDNPTLAAASVWISSGFQAGQDMLGFASDPLTMGNIMGSYDAASGVLALSSAGASATLSQWQAALRSVTYGNTSATPIVGMRSVSFDINDGTAYAVSAASHALNVNPAPVAPDPGPIVPPPPPVIPPVVVGPPPVTPPPSTPPPPSTQPAPAASGPAGAAVSEASADVPIQPVSVDIAERPHNPMVAVFSASETSAGTASALRLAVFGTAVQGVELAGGDLLGEMTRQSDSRSVTGLSQSGQGGRSGGEVVLTEEIESLREDLREQDEIQTRGTVALAAGSLSMTLAYLLWLVRGGALVASALSALPAWRILDPLPVLSRVNDDEDDEADEDDEQAIGSFEDELFKARQ